MLGSFLGPLIELLDLHDRDPQFRPPGLRFLAAYGVPPALFGPLQAVSGEEAAHLPDADLRRRLSAALPDPVDQAAALLNWLGHLPVPIEALSGEGVLVRRLLTPYPKAVLVAAAETPDVHITMGVVLWTLWHRDDDDGPFAAAVAPTLRRLFPPTG
ncbi:hypothetical protein KZZ52_56655 [Dactylosporangium sp. AC04546]|uniref:hypothetical protein n=1 Tax=Dactylosporangium sp. AC04546 TaxID=2862460 RepID=UPI001EDD4A28|nr:hypothetical protein [Dactylosporangium sp. AC04546]WVK83244.1 hypothetical protein KZZ52_56655 [Dactylosporangium sp. AC04546]